MSSRPATRSALLALTLAAWAAICGAASAAAAVEVTYVANAGILISGDAGKVLIDALVDGGIAGYPTAPPEIRRALEAAEPPFDGVDLVLATHHHADHFGPRAVARHLEANPRALFVSTPEAVADLRDHVGDASPLLARVREVLPAEGEALEMRFDGVGLTILNLHHGRDRALPVQNLGFLVELAGMRLLHVGDTMADADDFRRARLDGEAIDAAFLGCWYLVYDRWVEALGQALPARRLVGLHLPTRDAPSGYFSPLAGYDELVGEMRANFPEAVLLERPMAVERLAPATDPRTEGDRQ